MKVNECSKIEYLDANGNAKVRDIVPTYIPNPNIKALDVDHLSQSERSQLLTELEEYRQYRDLQLKRIISFENWLEHTGSSVDPTTLKWRSFASARITEK